VSNGRKLLTESYAAFGHLEVSSTGMQRGLLLPRLVKQDNYCRKPLLIKEIRLAFIIQFWVWIHVFVCSAENVPQPQAYLSFRRDWDPTVTCKWREYMTCIGSFSSYHLVHSCTAVNFRTSYRNLVVKWQNRRLGGTVYNMVQFADLNAASAYDNHEASSAHFWCRVSFCPFAHLYRGVILFWAGKLFIFYLHVHSW